MGGRKNAEQKRGNLRLRSRGVAQQLRGNRHPQCRWECKTEQPSGGDNLAVSIKLFDVALQLLGIYSIDKWQVHKDECVRSLLAALFVFTKDWKHPNYPSIGNW